eukprot:TRINITY_DN740_c0_g1_i1.p1 TRINITY_DN740_c0_g1~~TRINITY_DN740_c0_g1_i1.p1  ORF type:complete len:200 (+),score=56.06 TRINITY_DN740_c0_g1_i1:64-663(+)
MTSNLKLTESTFTKLVHGREDNDIGNTTDHNNNNNNNNDVFNFDKSVLNTPFLVDNGVLTTSLVVQRKSEECTKKISGLKRNYRVLVDYVIAPLNTNEKSIVLKNNTNQILDMHNYRIAVGDNISIKSCHTFVELQSVIIPKHSEIAVSVTLQNSKSCILLQCKHENEWKIRDAVHYEKIVPGHIIKRGGHLKIIDEIN